MAEARKEAESIATAPGGSQHLDQRTREGRAQRSRHGVADRQLGVAFDEVLPVHQRGQPGLVGDVEKDATDCGSERHGVELDQGEGSPQEAQGDGRQEEAAADVGRDHHSAARNPIDQDANWEAEHQERREPEGAQDPELHGSRVEKENRRGRHRQVGDLAAETADRLAEPEVQEVGVPPERAGEQPAPDGYRFGPGAAGRAITPSSLSNVSILGHLAVDSP